MFRDDSRRKCVFGSFYDSFKSSLALVKIYIAIQDTEKLPPLHAHAPVESEFEYGVKRIRKLVNEVKVVQLVEQFYATIYCAE